MSNAVPPADKRARMHITTDKAAKVWRDGIAAIARKHPHYQTTLRSGQPSGTANAYHLLGAAFKCGYAEVTDSNVVAVLIDIEQRAAQLYPAQPTQAALI